MKRLVLSLSDVMYAELQAASASAHEQMVTPETWATECVESALASIRLPRVELGRYGGRPGVVVERIYELPEYRVSLPDSQVIDS